jgi:hypothetical protein
MNKGGSRDRGRTGTPFLITDFESAKTHEKAGKSAIFGHQEDSQPLVNSRARDTVSQLRARFPTPPDWKARTVENWSGCWIWIGATRGVGYGAVKIGGRKGNQVIDAHRAAWMIVHGEIPVGSLVCHQCDVRKCCNPAHLFLGTKADNARDMTAKGRNFVRPGEASNLAKLTESEVVQIRELYKGGESQRAIGRLFGVSGRNVGAIVHRETWTHVA